MTVGEFILRRLVSWGVRRASPRCLKGDPDRGAMIVRSWRDAIESYLPHKGWA